ncbi:MAG: type I restriction-modification system subunit M N-terminal domain-containing protein [Pseudomonadota bacterium]
MNNFGEKVSFIWSVADLLRGPYRPNQYKDVMLPLTVLRRLDCVLEPTKDQVLDRMKKLEGGKVKNVEPLLCRVPRIYGQLLDGDHVRVFDNTEFGYRRITVERPQRLNFAVDDERLNGDIDDYVRREVLPHVPDAWVDESRTKIGYEVNFNRYFYKYTPPRPLHEIETDLKRIEAEIADMLAEVTK